MELVHKLSTFLSLFKKYFWDQSSLKLLNYINHKEGFFFFKGKNKLKDRKMKNKNKRNGKALLEGHVAYWASVVLFPMWTIFRRYIQ